MSDKVPLPLDAIVEETKVVNHTVHSLDELRSVLAMLDELHARDDGVAITITGDINVNVTAASTDMTEVANDG